MRGDWRDRVLGVLALGLLVVTAACRRGGEAPGSATGPTEPAVVTLRFRLVSAQTFQPVAGARVVVRETDPRDPRPGVGAVLAEAVSDAGGEVTLTYRDGATPRGNRPSLDIEAGPRFLPRQVYVDDTAEEPAPEVRTLWELRPEMGADFCTTVYFNYNCRFCEGNVCRPLNRPPKDLHVIVHPDFQPYMGYIEEGARRVERMLGDRWRWRFVPGVWAPVPEWPAEVPPDGLLVRVQPFSANRNCPSGSATGSVASRVYDVRICDPAIRRLSTIAHEFGHVAGLGHLTPGVRGVMCGRGEDCVGPDEDFTAVERWMAAPRRFRRPENRAPDNGLVPWLY
ncbi:MAG: hypothetical protein NZ742_03760 [Acidobacteria bacterium]|nr:hypothetical protein [Acidobacteriota bacterium]